MNRQNIISPSLLLLLSFCFMGFMALQDFSKQVSGSTTTTMMASAYNIFGSKREGEEEIEEDDDDEFDDEKESIHEFPISFTNKSQKKVHINWINQAVPGEEDMVIGNLSPGQTETIQSHPGHWFAVYDEDKTFRIVYIANEPEKTFVVRDEDTEANRAVQVQFINNASEKTVHINWMHRDTQEEKTVVENLRPGKTSGILDSYTNHHFWVFDDDYSFRVELQVDPGHAHGSLATFTIDDILIGNPKVVFLNIMEEPVHVNWVSMLEGGKETQVVANLPPGHESTPLNTARGHIFVAYDEERTFRTEFTVSKFHGTEVIRITGLNGFARGMTQFVNSIGEAVHVNYIEGQEEHPVVRNLAPNESSDILTVAANGHQFVAFNEARTFRQVFTHQGPLGMVESHTVMEEL